VLTELRQALLAAFADELRPLLVAVGRAARAVLRDRNEVDYTGASPAAQDLSDRWERLREVTGAWEARGVRLPDVALVDTRASGLAIRVLRMVRHLVRRRSRGDTVLEQAQERLLYPNERR
jgi:hypothetical protein